jgi:hypothetical protein
MSFSIYCADVGSVAANFGWAKVDRAGAVIDSGTGIDVLAARVAADLDGGESIALGFECPLWVPLPAESGLLGKARPGESGAGQPSRPWSAGAGLGSLAAGLVQVPWILLGIRSRTTAADPTGTTSWALFDEGKVTVLIWESMVTAEAKGESHVDDARIGALAFKASLPDADAADACPADGPVYSLAGAALLRAGWSKDPRLIAEPPLVIRA